MQQIETHLAKHPLIAILRGVTPDNVLDYATAIITSGIRVIEVPLNSPSALLSIGKLLAAYGDKVLVGAGTVLSITEIKQLKEMGAQFIISPHFCPELIQACQDSECLYMPGIATPSEAFQAIKLGASHLKLFPAQSYGPSHLQALKAVLPKHVKVYPVGGVNADNIKHWHAAGADGLGLGSSLFKASFTPEQVGEQGKLMHQQWFS